MISSKEVFMIQKFTHYWNLMRVWVIFGGFSGAIIWHLLTR